MKVSPGCMHAEENRHVGLCPRVRLHVGPLRTVEFADPLDGETLHLVHHLAAAVVTRRGIALRIFVVSTEPMASITSSLTKFSEAISSMPCI